jgi:3-oxoacyl-[acyl-carrier-protein] synthase II
MSEREVVITGLGLTTPLGKSAVENWSNVKSMKTGIIHDPKKDLPNYLQYIGRVSEYILPQDIAPKQMGQMKFLNRSAIFGFCAASEAVSPSRESLQDTEPGRRALYVAAGDFTKIGCDAVYPALKDGTGKKWGPIDYAKLNESALSKVNPFFLLESLNNNLFSFLSAYIEFMGPSTSLASLSPYGGNALELAYRSIKQNKADVAVAVGYGSWINDIVLYELEGLGIISKCRNGSGSYRPFDVNRDGFITGEGGAAILLESSERAGQRGAKILGKIRGVSNSIEFSPGHKFSVPEKVCEKSVLSVLEDASCGVRDLAFIVAHGSGTPKGDRSELNSLMDIFNEQKADAPVCGLKPYTGHMGAASDIAEIIFGIHAAREKTVPATLNFHVAEKRFSDLKISALPQECEKNQFLSVSYGVGGQSSTVVVEVL